MKLLLDVIEEPRGDRLVATVVPATVASGGATIFLLLVILLVLLFLLLLVATLVATRGVVMVRRDAAVHGVTLVFR
jgi:hypothetical protein